MAVVTDIISAGTHSGRPSASSSNDGFLYYETDTNKLFRSNGAAWVQVAPDATITGYSDEQAQDAIGGMLADTDTIDMTYTDATPELKADVKKQMSITSDSSGLKLSGDSATPGNNKVYGTDGSGVKGWKADPSGGGGGITHSYLGYNTVGGSVESMTPNKVYAKKITVAIAGILTSIGAYIVSHTSDDVVSLSCAVLSDNSGTPDRVIFYNNNPIETLLTDNTPGAGGLLARWLDLPCGSYLPPGDYWIAVQATGGEVMDITYDGSGSDRYYTSGGRWFADWGWYSPTTSSNKYSIRASFIS